jgi:hypothetical protein
MLSSFPAREAVFPRKSRTQAFDAIYCIIYGWSSAPASGGGQTKETGMEPKRKRLQSGMSLFHTHINIESKSPPPVILPSTYLDSLDHSLSVLYCIVLYFIIRKFDSCSAILYGLQYSTVQYSSGSG